MMTKILTFISLSLSLIAGPWLNAQPQGEISRLPSDSTMNQQGLTWLTNYSDALRESQTSSKPIVILFTGATWCPACVKLEKEVLKNPQFIQAVGSQFVFLKAEFFRSKQGGFEPSPYQFLLDRYDVESYPTMVVINAKGDQLFTVNYQPNGAQAYIQRLLNGIMTMRQSRE